MTKAKTQKTEQKKVSVKSATKKNVQKIIEVDSISLDSDFNEISEKVVLSCSTKCRTFSKPMIQKDTFFLRSDRSKCFKCSPEEKTVCFATKFQDTEFAIEKQSGRGFGDYPDFIKVWANGQKRGAMKKAVEAMVEKSEFTKVQIVDSIRKAFPDARPTVPGMYLGHGMRGKGKDAKRFPFKIVADAKGIISYDEKSPKGSWGQA